MKAKGKTNTKHEKKREKKKDNTTEDRGNRVPTMAGEQPTEGTGLDLWETEP